MFKLKADDAAEGDWFGSSVAISGDNVVVGANADNKKLGSAYVFRRKNSFADDWTQTGKLVGNGAQTGDFYGVSVAIGGDLVVVGARYDDDDGAYSGSAYVFRWDGASWTQAQKLKPDDAQENKLFGVTRPSLEKGARTRRGSPPFLNR